MNKSDMSKKGPEQKNMSSIALSLHGQLVRTKLGLYISANFFLFIALSLMTLFQIEWNHFGTELPDKIIHWAEGDIDRILTTRGEGIRNSFDEGKVPYYRKCYRTHFS